MIKKIFFCLFILCLFASCKSTSVLEWKSDLCGLVVDEYNHPVKDFSIYCRSTKSDKKATLTNESGIFVFNEIYGGTYFISGEKENYIKLKEEEFHFINKEKIICFQVMSIDSALNNINQLIYLADFKNALQLLEEISIGNNENVEHVIYRYKEFLLKKLSEQEELNEIS